jgi:energy-coupling factor transport system ATP-binding protein
VKDARATLEEKRRAGSRHGVADPVGSDFGSDGRRPNASSSRDRALATKNLWVRRSEREVLRGLDLEIAPGERVALMGRNGAGKTTLLRTVAGLEKPLRGRCATPRGSALVPQSPSDLLVREQVREELPGPAGMAALEAVDLSWAAATDPRDLSGGERQRLALALVLAGRRDGTLPALVCLDEPTRGMDRARKEALSDWLTDLARAGAAVLVATHEVEFAATFADRVVMIAEGVVIADGAPSEILSGGWYFATEVARILGGSGAIDAESGARLLGNVGVDVAAQEVRA